MQSYQYPADFSITLIKRIGRLSCGVHSKRMPKCVGWPNERRRTSEIPPRSRMACSKYVFIASVIRRNASRKLLLPAPLRQREQLSHLVIPNRSQYFCSCAAPLVSKIRNYSFRLRILTTEMNNTAGAYLAVIAAQWRRGRLQSALSVIFLSLQNEVPYPIATRIR